jgi:regulatory protein
MDAENHKNSFWSLDEARANIKRYCVYQDRCHAEVRKKLLDHGIFGDTLEDIISDLISEDFLNEERYCRSFVRGKFNIKGWGRNKIITELKQKKISPYCLKFGLEEIDEEIYVETLRKWIESYDRKTKFMNGFDRLNKLTNFGLRKGYEYDLVYDVVKKWTSK